MFNLQQFLLMFYFRPPTLIGLGVAMKSQDFDNYLKSNIWQIHHFTKEVEPLTHSLSFVHDKCLETFNSGTIKCEHSREVQELCKRTFHYSQIYVTGQGKAPCPRFRHAPVHVFIHPLDCVYSQERPVCPMFRKCWRPFGIIDLKPLHCAGNFSTAKRDSVHVKGVDYFALWFIC